MTVQRRMLGLTKFDRTIMIPGEHNFLSTSFHVKVWALPQSRIVVYRLPFVRLDRWALDKLYVLVILATSLHWSKLYETSGP
jgi:hypothetical protein